MTRPGIEPQPPELLANTLLIRPMTWCVCVCVCVCIYIFIYLLIYYLPAFTVTRKKEKHPRQEQEIKISRITAWGEKRKNIIGQKERKGQPRHTS